MMDENQDVQERIRRLTEALKQSDEARKQSDEARKQSDEALKQRDEDVRQRDEALRQKDEELGSERKAREGDQKELGSERKAREADQKEYESERKAREADQKVHERLTLKDYLFNCQQYLSNSISVQTIKPKTTKGGVDNAARKEYPDTLKPWDDYIEQHNKTLELLSSVYPSSQPPVFDSISQLQALGNAIKKQKIASHADLEFVVRLSIEQPIAEIMRCFESLDEVKKTLNLPRNFRFENHRNSLNKDSQTPKPLQPLPSTPGQPRDAPGPKNAPDQYGIYTTVEGRDKAALVGEFKPPHKLSLETLRRLFKPNRPEINLVEIDKRILGPAGPSEAREQHEAEHDVAAVITQAFSYMVQCETQYGYFTTGEAFVFLYYDPEGDMRTARYYLFESNKDDSDAQDEQQQGDLNAFAAVKHTTLTHLMTLVIRALQSAQEGKRWREKVTPVLNVWGPTDQEILAQIPETPTPAGKFSDYQPGPDSSPESPIKKRLHSRKRKRRDNPPGPPSKLDKKRGPPSASDDDDGPSNPRRFARPTATVTKKSRRARSPGPPVSPTHDHRQQSYCTQLCLQGLARGGPLDQRCPNVSKHCEKGHRSDRHPLNREEFRDLLEEQLRRSRGADFHALGKEGARGALFKVTLTLYSYTIVAKGTVSGFVRYLRHEAEMYKRLAAIQGTHVPVFLGSLDLDYIFYYDAGVRIVHMMLMSWSGEPLDHGILTDADKEARSLGSIEVVTALHEAGIVHQDVRPPNLLWSEELQRVMAVDFERAEIIKATRPALSSQSTNKKIKRLPATARTENDEPSQNAQRCSAAAGTKNRDEQGVGQDKEKGVKMVDSTRIYLLANARAKEDLLNAEHIFKPISDAWVR